MKQFIAFVRKEFYHIFRDRRTMMILLVMPIVEIILFGFVLTTEVKNVEVAVLDPAKDVVTRALTDRIEASEYFHVTRMLNSPEEIESAFRDGKTDLVLVFEESFNENLYHAGKAQLQLVADATNPNMSTLFTGYAMSIVGEYQRELMRQGNIPYPINTELKLLYNPQMKSAYNFVPGVMGLILMLICAMMTSISIVREREVGTMEVLLVSPVKPIFIIVAKVVPYFVLSCVNLVTILLLSVFVLHVPVAGNLGSLLFVSLLFILVSLALGILISSITRTQVAAMLISGMVLMMPVMILSGLVFPVESMPDILQWVSNIIPAKWFIMAVRKIMIEGLPIIYVWREIVIMTFMALLLVVVSLKKFKTRME